MKRLPILPILVLTFLTGCPAEMWIPIQTVPRQPVKFEHVQYLEAPPDRPYDVIGIIRQHQPGIVFYAIKPASASRLADEVRSLPQQLRHRMIEAAHQRAVDEETIQHHAPRAAKKLKPPRPRR